MTRKNRLWRETLAPTVVVTVVLAIDVDMPYLRDGAHRIPRTDVVAVRRILMLMRQMKTKESGSFRGVAEG